MFVYLATAIDQANSAYWTGSEPPANQVQMLSSVYDLLRPTSMFRPKFAYNNVQDAADQRHVHEINRAALFEADALVAVVSPGIPSLGVPVEIQWALNQGKPTIIITTPTLLARSVQMRAWVDAGAIPLDGSALDGVDLVGIIRQAQDDLMIDHLQVSSLIKPPPLDAADQRHVHEINRAALFEADAHLQVSSPIKPPPLLVKGEPEATIPTRGAYTGDAGIDLPLLADSKLDPGEYRLLSTGLTVAIPDGYFGWITGRSSTWARFKCCVGSAVIDSGYRGQLMVGIQNQSGDHIQFAKGMRLAQIVLLPTFQGSIVEVDSLPESDRGTNGYGSTGH